MAPAVPRILRTYRREGTARHRSPTGEVGRIFRGAEFEVVWVNKRREAIDRRWFSLGVTDVLVVVRGRLRVEFEDRRWRPRVLGVGDVLVLPPRTKCRAYRWPRGAGTPTIFLAVYARRPLARGHGRVVRRGGDLGRPPAVGASVRS